MKKKISLCLVAVAAIGIATANVLNVRQSKKEVSLRLANIMALSDENGNESGGGTGDGESGEWGCGGNPTYIPNETLRTHSCTIGGLTGTHLVCESHEKVCCDPSRQTDCEKISFLSN